MSKSWLSPNTRSAEWMKKAANEAARRIFCDFPDMRMSDIPAAAQKIMDELAKHAPSEPSAPPQECVIPGVAGESPCSKCGIGMDGAFEELICEAGQWRHVSCPNSSHDGWISVEERLPDADVKCLVARSNDHPKIDLEWYTKRDKWSSGFYSDGEMDTNVTHWMPLPTAPGLASAPSAYQRAIEDAAKVTCLYCQEEATDPKSATRRDGDAHFFKSNGRIAARCRAAAIRKLAPSTPENKK